jgi:hypothetical protein
MAAQPTDTASPAPGIPETSAPEPEPSTPAPVPPSDVPSIAATLEIPPAEPTPGDEAAGFAGIATAGAEGGEWDLLVAKVKEWFADGKLQRLWERWREPLRILLLFIALVLLLRLYGSVVRTIDAIPLVGGLLELVGLLVLVRFSLTHLVRAEERERLFSEWRHRWNDFRGRL